MYYFLQNAQCSGLEKDETSVYAQFQELDNVHLTPGNVTDYTAIRRLISGKYMEGGVLSDPDNLMEKYPIMGSRTTAGTRSTSSPSLRMTAFPATPSARALRPCRSPLRSSRWLPCAALCATAATPFSAG